MSAEHNQALVCRLLSAIFEERDYAAIDALVTRDFIDHEAPDRSRGPEPLKPYFAALHEAFPDLVHVVEQVIAQGDFVSVRSRWEGTHYGPYAGLTGTGRRVSVEGMTFWRVADGKVAERWAVLDRLALLRQLGAAPDAPSPGHARNP